MMFGYGYGPGGFVIMLFWILVIGGLAALLFRAFAAGPRPSQPEPLQILAARYARGELSEQEFLRMRDQIGKQ